MYPHTVYIYEKDRFPVKTVKATISGFTERAIVRKANSIWPRIALRNDLRMCWDLGGEDLWHTNEDVLDIEEGEWHKYFYLCLESAETAPSFNADDFEKD